MKKLIFVIFICLGTTVFAQKVDWENAPLNPVAFKYKLEDFNLKNVIAYNDKFFKDGKLMYDNAKSAKQYYKYNDAGVLLEDSDEHTYTFNDKQQLIAISSSKYDKDAIPKNYKFEYESNGQLKSRTSLNNSEIISYSYYTDSGQLKSQIVTYKGVESQIDLFMYSMENKLLKIKKYGTNIRKGIIENELFFYDRGVLVKKIDMNGQETTWKTKTDEQGNYLQEMDVTFNKKDLSNGLNLSYRQDKRVAYFNNTYLESVFINEKPAAFMPVFNIKFSKYFFDLFNQDYYTISTDATSANGFKISILAKNNEAISIKPADYNEYYNNRNVFYLIYAGLNRNPTAMFSGHSKINVHRIGYRETIIYDRFFDTNYYTTNDPKNGVYVLSEALPVMFYVTEEKEQKLYHFVVNGIEINPSRLNLYFANNNEDASVNVDNKPTYYIKGLKNLENKKVYYPTVL